MYGNVFEKTVLQELKAIRKEVKDGQKQLNLMEIRQNEIYQVVRAIEHSNEADKSELDSHNIRLSKVEGKFKRISSICDENDNVSNL